MNENVTVCITPKGEKPVLHFSQFDNENVFTVTVLADDGESAAVLTGLDIEFRLRKTDSHVVTIAPESVSDNVITFKTTEQMCACCGQNIASVTLMKDDMVISTLDILVNIQRDILSGGLTSESDIRNLTSQIEQIVPEVIGDDYYTKSEVDALIDSIPTFDPSNYYDKSDVDGLLADKADSDDVYTKGETDTLLADKADIDDVMVKITRHGMIGDMSSFTFTNNCIAPMDDIECDVEAVQDLHGYTKPWSGGGGKNKLPLTVNGIKALNAGTWSGNSITLANVNFTILTDADGNVTGIRANGTATSAIVFNLTDTSNKTFDANCKINGVPSGLSGISLRLTYSGGQIIAGSGADETIPADTYANATFVIYVLSGTSLTNVTVTPMVRVSSASADFEPYENICPISGHSSCTITVADSDNTPVNSCTVNFGQTVYGGEVNVTGGKVTKDKGFIICDGSENWQVSGSGSGQIFYLTIPDMESGLNLDGISNYIKTFAGSTAELCIRFGYNSNIIFIYSGTTITGVTDLESFKTYLSNNPLELCYSLATPADITFTPATTDTINGTNKVSSSTGNMKSLTYFSDVNSDLVDLIRACMI